jgi:hypothetical protein
VVFHHHPLAHCLSWLFCNFHRPLRASDYQFTNLSAPITCPTGTYLPVASNVLASSCAGSYYPTTGCQCLSNCTGQYYSSNLTQCVNSCAGNEYSVNTTSNATCISCGAQYVNSLRNGCVASCATGEVLVGSQCVDPDCTNLINIWNSMSGAASAFVNGVCCGVNGVTCDATNTYVTQVTWSNSSLSGSIPTSIGNLTHLTTL